VSAPLPRRWLERHAAGAKPLAGLVSLAVVVAASTTLVRLGNGDFSSAYELSALFPTASAGLHPGSQVEEDGVQIGSVREITLDGGEALVTLGIASGYRVPRDALATIEPENLFGADQIAISRAPGSVPRAGSLPAGSRIPHTRVRDELGQLFSSADPLLSKIDTADLATAVDELAAAFGGQGREIGSSLRAGTELTSLLARTIPAQLAAVDALTRFATAIEGEGPTLDQLAYDGNRTMPLFDAAESAYARLLSQFGAFSSRLAGLLGTYRPTVDTLIDRGDDVLRVLLTQRQNVAQLLQGLAMYAYKFAHGMSSATLPDGSRFAYFKTFIVWGDVQSLICSLLAPARPGLGFLEPLQRAVLGGNTMLDCAPQLAAFDQAQGSMSSESSAKESTGRAGVPMTSGAGGIESAARSAARAVYGAIAAPEPPLVTSLGAYVDSLLPAYQESLP